MNNSDHERARDLVMSRGVEGLRQQESVWLDQHLAECAECSDFSASLRETAQMLRRLPVAATSALVSATRTRVRVRAAELREQEMRHMFIAISFCIGALSSAFSAYVWWKLGAFLADRFGMPASIVQPGIFVASTLPAVVIAVVMLAWSGPVIDRSVTLALLSHREGSQR